MNTLITPKFTLLGVLGAGRAISVWYAYSLAAAALVATVTQLTVIFTVLAGGTLLDEDYLYRRLAGASLIVVGVLLVLLL